MCFKILNSLIELILVLRPSANNVPYLVGPVIFLALCKQCASYILAKLSNRLIDFPFSRIKTENS